MSQPTHRRLRKWLTRLGTLLATLCAIATIGFGAYRGWIAAGANEPLGPIALARGISYQRVPLRSPRRAVTHLLRIDLRTEGLRMFITPPSSASASCFRARTTRDFLEQHSLTVAVNGAFFHPFWNHGPWNYYPHPGDCAYVLGRWVAQGQGYGTAWKGASISFNTQLQPQLGYMPDAPWVVTGKELLVRAGVAQRVQVGPADQDAHPYARHVFGVHRDGFTLMSIFVDGKQPGYSDGLTLAEAAAIAAQQGCDYAIELDGGGSVSLVARGGDGALNVLNRPFHTRVPGRLRPIANQIGFWAPPLAGQGVPRSSL